MDIILSFTGRERRSDLSALGAPRSADHLERKSKKSVVVECFRVKISLERETNKSEERIKRTEETFGGLSPY